ncbi:MAG TPA: hypothetical protein VGI43_14955 [Mucilaginibacter sp.]|jgi:hypothetical protein
MIFPTPVVLTTQMHVWYRLGGNTKEEDLQIRNLFDLESKIDKEKRLFQINNAITDKIIDAIQPVNNEEELLEEIKKIPYSSMIPLVVKAHFNLSEWGDANAIS